MPENLYVLVEQSSDEVEEAVADDAGKALLAPETTSVLPEDDDASGDDAELHDPGIAVASCPSETTRRCIQWSLSHQPHSPPTGVAAPTVLHQALYTIDAIPVNKGAIEHGQ